MLRRLREVLGKFGEALGESLGQSHMSEESHVPQERACFRFLAVQSHCLGRLGSHCQQEEWSWCYGMRDFNGCQNEQKLGVLGQLHFPQLEVWEAHSDGCHSL